jgi:hypothetical protein
MRRYQPTARRYIRGKVMTRFYHETDTSQATNTIVPLGESRPQTSDHDRRSQNVRRSSLPCAELHITDSRRPWRQSRRSDHADGYISQGPRKHPWASQRSVEAPRKETQLRPIYDMVSLLDFSISLTPGFESLHTISDTCLFSRINIFTLASLK